MLWVAAWYDDEVSQQRRSGAKEERTLSDTASPPARLETYSPGFFRQHLGAVAHHLGFKPGKLWLFCNSGLTRTVTFLWTRIATPKCAVSKLRSIQATVTRAEVFRSEPFRSQPWKGSSPYGPLGYPSHRESCALEQGLFIAPGVTTSILGAWVGKFSRPDH